MEFKRSNKRLIQRTKGRIVRTAPAQTGFFCGGIRVLEHLGIANRTAQNIRAVSDAPETRTYQKTLAACYLGFVTQAISANFVPLLFLTFQAIYKLSLEQIALIPVVFYLTQLLIDLGATRFADKIGYRICVVSSQVLSAMGLVLLTVLPDMLPVPFLGILISVVFYAIGSGLVEVLVRPIVEACPFEDKDGRMSLLHSFYCWGAVGVILGSTLFFAAFGTAHWKILTLIWALVPLVNVFQFLSCPIARLTADGEGLSPRKLLRLPLLWMMILLMICSGASEATMAQWASAFTESALACPKQQEIWPALACLPFPWGSLAYCTEK